MKPPSRISPFLATHSPRILRPQQTISNVSTPQHYNRRDAPQDPAKCSVLAGQEASCYQIGVVFELATTNSSFLVSFSVHLSNGGRKTSMAVFALNVSIILGPLIGSAFVCVFFFGVICMQVVHYLRAFPNDVLLFRGTVISLWVLQLVYTIFICQGVYTMTVFDFGEISALLSNPWGINWGIVVGSLIDHGVQAFLVARIYRTTRYLWPSLFLWTVVALLQAASLIIAVEAMRSDLISVTGQRWRWLLELMFFSDATLDILNACILGIYLKLQSQRASSRSTAAAIDQLVVYTLQTGLTTSIVALAAAISFKVAPENYLWTAFFMAMPGSFMSALLANINNRKTLSQPSSVVTGSGHNHNRSISHGILPQGQLFRSTVFSRDDHVIMIGPTNSMELDKMERFETCNPCAV